ncbi:hypothetical protein V6N11_051586 [Hibiscus sabdariffa]|uniref:RRM domain-containing protein n=1 Tax=Hibiscus sabdariffa TaxID=183260 RepID=A0ABR2U7T2_9ROSI
MLATEYISILSRTFQVFGEILDVYVAFNNQRRRFKKTSFAFVKFKSDEEARRAIERGSRRLVDGFRISVFIAWSNKDKQDSIKFGKVHRGRIVFPVRDFRSYKEALMGGKIHNQQKETNRLSYVDNLNHHNDVNLTEMWVSEKEKRKENIRNGWSNWLQLLDVPVNIVEDSPIRVVGVGVGQVFSTNIAGRETSFESLSNESRLQEMPVENVVELARQASPLQAQQ